MNRVIITFVLTLFSTASTAWDQVDVKDLDKYGIKAMYVETEKERGLDYGEVRLNLEGDGSFGLLQAAQISYSVDGDEILLVNAWTPVAPPEESIWLVAYIKNQFRKNLSFKIVRYKRGTKEHELLSISGFEKL